MNISLTLNFDTIAELQGFLSGRASQGPAVAQPLAVVETAKPAAVVAEVVAEVDPLDMIGEVATADEVVDLDAYRAELKMRLAAKAGTMEEPKILGAFITGFGVQKFSDLPDDMLIPFNAAFIAEFGA